MTSHAAGDLCLRSPPTVTLTFIMARKKEKKHHKRIEEEPDPSPLRPQEEGGESVERLSPFCEETQQDIKT